MNSIKKFLKLALVLLLVASPLLGKEDHRLEQQPVALELAVNIPGEGILKQKDNGFVYLDVSNDFIDNLVPMLNMPGELRKRPTATRSMGAHISVFYEKEEVVPVELGQSFSFEVQDIRSFSMHTRDGTRRLWVVSVVSPELEWLRQSYGCSALLKGHAFHITLGKQMPSAPFGWQDREYPSEFNFSNEPTLGMNEVGDFVPVENEQLIELASRVDAIGQLKLRSNGYVYVDVDDSFVEELSPLLDVSENFEPLETGDRKLGAHISVFYEDEMIKHEIWDLEEAGEWFTFEVKALHYVDLKRSTGPKRCWFITVDSPALQRLRIKYGLKPKLQGYDFHITLGYEPLDQLKEAA